MGSWGGWKRDVDGGGVLTYPSPWFCLLRTAAEAAVAVRRVVVVVVVNFIVATCARGEVVWMRCVVVVEGRRLDG